MSKQTLFPFDVQTHQIYVKYIQNQLRAQHERGGCSNDNYFVTVYQHNGLIPTQDVGHLIIVHTVERAD